jgi:hypothetical protein
MQGIYPLERPFAHVYNLLKDIADSSPSIEGVKFSLVKSKPEHAFGLDLRPEQAGSLDLSDYDYLVRVSAWYEILTPMNYSLFFGEDLIMLMNIMPTSDGVAEICFLTDNNLRKLSIPAKRTFMSLMKQAIDIIPFHRVQAKVDSNFKMGQRFVEHLGLEKEGVLRSYGKDRVDHIMYSIIKE